MDPDSLSADRATRRRRRKRMWLSNALFAFAILSAAYPSLTGVYTWYAQHQMQAGLEQRFNAAEQGARSRDASLGSGPWAGWRSEDRAYWMSLKEAGVFGRLVIPRIGLNIAVVKGVSKEDLKLGPGWAMRTDLPGPSGNVGISGHRTTYLAPFRYIDQMKRGDLIYIESPFRVYTYRVVRQFIVDPSQVSVFDGTKQPMLTLTACHPPYSAAQRIVTRAALVKVMRRRPGGGTRASN
jgi:LPXTG-site transpeptidase (sortase) family protein